MLIATVAKAVSLVFFAVFVYLVGLVIRALLKYIYSKDVREERRAVRASLGETIKAHRQRCQMTQEFVAEAVGVSRQAVSKWESGASDPSTGNLIALAKLFGVSPGELLREAG